MFLIIKCNPLFYLNYLWRHPVSLEQYIMEGSYNKILHAKGNVPAESFKYFIDVLLNTVRDEIASCLEKSYPEIGCADAARMLSLPTGITTEACFKVIEKNKTKF